MESKFQDNGFHGSADFVRCMESAGRLICEDLLAGKPAWIGGNISPDDAVFLSGALFHWQPGKYVEIGVASGWSGVIALETSRRFKKSMEWHGIDLSREYYLEKGTPTGRAISDVHGDRFEGARLHLGELAFDAMPDIGGGVDFSFIDAHHMHPWATIDLLSVLPFMGPGAMVALHDLNLCRFPRHKHMNRGPFYLYYQWPGPKICSSPDPAMIGAIKLFDDPNRNATILLETLHNPWEISLPMDMVDSFKGFLDRHYDAEVAKALCRSIDEMNPV